MLMNCPLRKPLPVGQAGRVRASQESQKPATGLDFGPIADWSGRGLTVGNHPIRAATLSFVRCFF